MIPLIAAGWLLFFPAVASPAACVSCHKSEAVSQPATSMAKALQPASECRILREHPLLTFKRGRYFYSIKREGDRSIYTVTDGDATLSVPVGWAFGVGTSGQTYVFERDGIFYESRVSYYDALGAIDLTMGAQNAQPQSLIDAAGREMRRGEVAECFQCHSTGGVQDFAVHFKDLRAGVQCENCHAQADQHVGSLKPMASLGMMTPASQVEFCGRCHRTWEQIATNGPFGVYNVRFAPYRLVNSKCFDPTDRRIGCTSCHNPHVEIARGTASYDPKCLACHDGGAKALGKICHVAKADCVSCHMPKVDLPAGHYRYTDHEIRIVRANGAYPD